MRDAVAASTATPLLTFSGPQLTLNLAPLRDAVSSMHFQVRTSRIGRGVLVFWV